MKARMAAGHGKFTIRVYLPTCFHCQSNSRHLSTILSQISNYDKIQNIVQNHFVSETKTSHNWIPQLFSVLHRFRYRFGIGCVSPAKFPISCWALVALIVGFFIKYVIAVSGVNCEELDAVSLCPTSGIEMATSSSNSANRNFFSICETNE